MLVAFSVAPAGGSSSDSVHDAVAAAVKVVRDSGLPNRTDSMFTTIEGDWDECLAVVRAAVDAVQAYGSRVSLVLKADIRPGHTGELTGKLDRLEAAIAGQVPPAQAEPEWQPGAAASPDPVRSDQPDGATGEPADASADAMPVAGPEPTILARFVALDPQLVVEGAGDDDLPIACAPDARVLVADSAPPPHLGLVELSRATLRTDTGSLRISSGGQEAWRGDAGHAVSVVVWADDPEIPKALWVELAR